MHAPSAVSNRMPRAATDLRPAAAPPWSVDRWGRLIAGASVLAFTALALTVHPWWIAGTLGAAANLVITSLTDRCPLRDTLLRMGAKEREDLFHPGGAVRRPPVLHKCGLLGEDQ